LSKDLDQYLRRRLSTPWSAPTPRPLWRGIWPVLRHPLRTLELAADRRRVTGRRAVLFALVVSAAVVAVWPAIFWGSELAFAAPGWLRHPRELQEGVLYVWQNDVVRRPLYVLIWKWEAWSVLRWWLFFLAACAVATERRERRAMWRRLLLFSPWIGVLDLLLALGALAQGAAPEPYNVWATVTWWQRDLWSLSAWPAWRYRMAMAMLPVGWIFMRSVTRWRPLGAGIAAALFVPAAIYLSILWTDLWCFLPR
jgi:hypothetical protein